MWAKISSQDMVSGTNCQLQTSAYWVNDPDVTNPEWASAKIKWIKLELGDKVIEYTPPANNQGCLSFPLRWSSTEFIPGTTTARFTAKFELVPIDPDPLGGGGNSGGGGSNPPEPGPEHTVTTTDINISIVNTALVSRTTVESNYNPPPPPPNPFDGFWYSQCAQRGAADAVAKFTAMKHTVLGGTEHTKAELVGGSAPGGLYALATAVFEFTHGAASYLTDKTSGMIGMEEFSSATHSRGNTVPPPNFAAIYACSGNPGSNLWADAMGMPAVDRAAVAFGFPVASLLNPGDLSVSIPGYQFSAGVPTQVLTNGSLDQHSAKLLAELGTGKTLATSRESANGEYPPRKFGLVAGDIQYLDRMDMEMCYRSDPHTRLKKLYKLEEEDGYVQKLDWHKLFEELIPANGGGQ